MKPEKGSGKARREAEAKDRQLYSKAYSRGMPRLLIDITHARAIHTSQLSHDLPTSLYRAQIA